MRTKGLKPYEGFLLADQIARKNMLGIEQFKKEEKEFNFSIFNRFIHYLSNGYNCLNLTHKFISPQLNFESNSQVWVDKIN